MNLAELQAARAQKIYEYGELSYEIRLLEQRLQVRSKQFYEVAEILDEFETKIDELQNSQISQIKSPENLEN